MNSLRFQVPQGSSADAASSLEEPGARAQKPMDLENRLDALIRLAEQVGLDVRYESMDGTGGGLCRFRGRRVLFVDTSAEPEQRYERLLHALAPMPELEHLYIAPELREELDRRRSH